MDTIATNIAIGTKLKGRDIWGRTGKSIDRHTFIWLACELCGKCRWISETQYKRGERKKCKRCSDRINIRVAIKCVKPRPFHPNILSRGEGYISERIPRNSPYIRMADAGNYVLQHHLAIANALRRCLCTHELVHHLNGIRSDNRIENLVLVNSHNHPRYTYIHALQARIRQLEQLQLL